VPVDPTPELPSEPETPAEPEHQVTEAGLGLIDKIVQEAEEFEHRVIHSVIGFLEKLEPKHRHAVIDHLQSLDK
jgi:hypothetical protein